MAKLISKTYGDALFDVAMESGRLDDFLEEAKAVKELLHENEDLVKLMNHPKVPKEEKVELLENCFSKGISKELLGTLRLMVVKDRTQDFDEVLDYFITRVKDYKNIGLATVTVAMPLTDAQKEKIKQRLLETTDYVEFEINYEVDESLIGGMVIRIKDRVMDSSVKSKIARLQRELSNIQLKAGESAP
ncbi:MAG: ATP synthase F1 subunit delta [Lachnospiraceae bacterium]|jgi:F-type H+-transporting ATPase subunit delta|nr:ATP synthase F1 subunit delta [Lachnospiraceae bacterium]